MRIRKVLAALVAVTGLIAAGAQSAGAQAPHGLVFVQTNELSGNRIVVYGQGADGLLTPAGTYATGGLGGAALPGTESDRLASQGSLAYDAQHRLLIAVNAGSDTVSTFRVKGDRLRLTAVVPSGGQFPASVGIHDGLVYVLNSGGAGTLQGFRVNSNGLTPIPDSTRTLGLANTNPPNFLTSPGQVGFSPDGRQLIVATKASGSTIDVFQVNPNGRLSTTPVANASATPVPFAFTFDPLGRLVSGEAGTSSLTTYRLGPDGTLGDSKSQSDGQTALCWIQRVGDVFYVSNTGSNTLSSFRIDGSGQPTLLNAVAATTNPGPIDLATSNGFLYVETGSTGTVDEFRVNSDGSLTQVGSISGLPAGLEGIATA